MKEHVQNSKTGQTVQPKAGNQAPVGNILSRYDHALQSPIIAGRESSVIEHTKPVLQGKFYDSVDNAVTDRPPETAEIKKAKDKAKEKSAIDGQPVNEFTAHHKYPWNKIKEDIQTAFTAPKTEDSLKALTNLETFASVSIPTTRESFLNSSDHRKTTYKKNESKFDNWIQNVCWVPGNIFLGPLSDKRLDDPSKRADIDDFDGHFSAERSGPRLTRRMSMRSDMLRGVYDSGGLSKSQANISDNTVAAYQPAEWTSHEIGEGQEYAAPMFSQTFDPYFAEKIFPYKVLSTKDLNFTDDIYELSVKTDTTMTVTSCTCNKNVIRARDGKAELNGNIELTRDDLDAKIREWKIKFPIGSNNVLDNFKMLLKKDSGMQKEILVNEIRVIRTL